MKQIRSVTVSALCLLGCLPAMRAQFLVTYPGPQGLDPTVGVYNTATGQLLNSFSSLPSSPVPLPGETGALKILSTSTGAQHFIISDVAGPAITIVGTFYRGQKSFGNFASPVTSAVISPNDLYLIVGEATVHFFNTTSYTDMTPGGIAIPDTLAVADLAMDYDSLTAYVLSTGVTQNYLTTISLAPLASGQVPTIVQTVPVPAGADFVTIAPNGLIYISSPNVITELNPTTLAPTPGGTIALSINPGRPVFTPAGQYLLAADLAPVAGGTAAVLVDLPSHTVAGTLPFNGLTDPISELYVVSDSVVYALVQGTTTLWTLQIGANGGLILTVPPFAANLAAAVNPGSVTDVAAISTSPDFGPPGRNAPQYLFLATASSSFLYVIDPVSLAIVNQFPDSANFVGPPGGLSYFLPDAGTSSTSTLVYGNNQTVPLGGVSLPLVVRALDENGYPVAGEYVEFYPPAPTTGTTTVGVLTPADPSNPGDALVVTGSDGYAEAFFTAGNLSTDIGTVSIGTTAANSPSFDINIGTGIPAAPASLTIVSGQGQVVFQDPTSLLPTAAPMPLVVIAKDASGNPVPNAAVIFATVPSNSAATPSVTQTLLTDSTGQATATFCLPALVGSSCGSSSFTAPFSPPYPNFATETITATSGTLSTAFYITTVPNAVVSTTGCSTPPCTATLPQMALKVVKPAYGSTITGSAGSTIPGAIQIIVTSFPYDLPIPNVGVSVSTGASATLPNARCLEPTGSGVILTDINGAATCDLLLNDIPGTQSLMVFVPQQTSAAPGFANITITPNPPATVTVVSGNNQFSDTGTTLTVAPLTVQVTDSLNNPIPLTPVTWKITSGSISLMSASATTDTTGTATAIPVLGAIAGAATVTVTAGAASATFTVNVVTPAADISVVSGNNQSAQNNSAFTTPLVVQVVDNNGNPANFAGVTFSTSSITNATFAGAPVATSSVTVTTDANGQASVSVVAGNPGPVVITVASTDAIASTLFSLTSLSPAPSGVQVLNAASFLPSISPGTLVSLTGSTLTPTIQGVVTDTVSLQSAGYTVTVGSIVAPILALVNENGVQQINAQIPFELAPGPASIIIQTPQGSTAVNITANTLSPGIFTSGTVTVNGSTFPEAVALRPDGTYVSVSNPALQGEYITFFTTGLGQTIPTAVTSIPGVPGQIVYAPLFVAINHLSAMVTSAVYQVGTNGVYAVTAQIPMTSAVGPGQPISLYILDSTGAGYTAPDVYIPIAQ